MDELDEAVKVFCCDLSEKGSVCLLGMSYYGGILDSPSRSADRSSRHIGSVSRRRALLIRRCPYMHLLPARHAADIREPAFHLGRAGIMSAIHSKF